jgi:hypothetical protein
VDVWVRRRKSVTRPTALVRKGDPKIDASYAITMPECENYSLFIFCSEVVILIVVIDDEW